MWQCLGVVCVCFGVFVPFENFHSFWRRHNYRWSAANLTYARHSRPLSSEGSITCHTYCDTGQLFIIRGPVTPVAQRLAVELSLPVQRFRSVPTGDQTPISRMRGEHFTTTPPLWLSSSYEKRHSQWLCIPKSVASRGGRCSNLSSYRHIKQVVTSPLPWAQPQVWMSRDLNGHEYRRWI